ncbi:MAG: hypothetical protein U5K54_01700 [Cytophagales bacterium]|nr:hypothetical protein [Cytophagales bacterium]
MSNSNPKAWVNVTIQLQDKKCIYTVENSLVEKPEYVPEKSGIGLKNVKRRLDLSYPNQ